LRRNCLLQRVIEWKIQNGIEVRENEKATGWTSSKERLLLFEGGSSGPNYVDSSLWKRLWNYRKTDYLMNEWIHL
jgi:hypothetical protein